MDVTIPTPDLQSSVVKPSPVLSCDTEGMIMVQNVKWIHHDASEICSERKKERKKRFVPPGVILEVSGPRSGPILLP